MISEETNKLHQKHAKLAMPDLGDFGRNEIAILGTTCATIRKLAYTIVAGLPAYKVAYVDADHKNANEVDPATDIAILSGASLEYTDKISFQRVDLKNSLNRFQKRTIFNLEDLVLVNGNHFTAKSQVVIVDPVKNLEKKIDKLTDVRLIVLQEGINDIPNCIRSLPGFERIHVVSINDAKEIIRYIDGFLSAQTPHLNGLVLSGGQSTRMKKDKGTLNYHGVSQREYMYELLLAHCNKTFISCNAAQAESIGNLPFIQDSFLNLGPMSGILSAFNSDPNAAWLTVACDLPYLTPQTIEYLVRQRDPSKIATSFLDPAGEFPEPLITIWEPRSYSILLQFLSQGYACPRKALINSDIRLLKAPEPKEFLNVNLPEQYEKAIKDLRQ